MAASPGRTSEGRAVVSVTTANASTALTGFAANAIQLSDIGRPITGAGIPAGATIVARPTTTTATLSANATASATVTVTLGASGVSLGFIGWSPETDAEAAVYPIAAGAGATAPSILTDAVTRVNQRNR